MEKTGGTMLTQEQIELKRHIKELEDEEYRIGRALDAAKSSCGHVIPGDPSWSRLYGGAFARCEVCGERLGWYCPPQPDKGLQLLTPGRQTSPSRVY